MMTVDDNDKPPVAATIMTFSDGYDRNSHILVEHYDHRRHHHGTNLGMVTATIMKNDCNNNNDNNNDPINTASDDCPFFDDGPTITSSVQLLHSKKEKRIDSANPRIATSTVCWARRTLLCFALVMLHVLHNLRIQVRSAATATIMESSVDSTLRHGRSLQEHQQVIVVTDATMPSPFVKERHERYVTSIKSFDRQILFVHIPKTGGTTMEIAVAARQANLSWGICRIASDDNVGCPSDAIAQLLGVPRFYTGKRPYLWHVPPAVFPVYIGKQPNRRYSHPYAGADTFAVVRDPMERMLSEYWYSCRHQLPKCKTDMNAFFRKQIAGFQTDYFSHWMHFIPQYDYILGPLSDASEERQIRYTDHVLSIDYNMTDTFADLMRAYVLPLSWPTNEKENASTNKLNKNQHTSANENNNNNTSSKAERLLQPDVYRLVHDVYLMDYQILPPRRQ